MEQRGAGRARFEPGIAIGIAVLLSVAWSVADWTWLTALTLPDPDDMMRLVQIRDWIGGQAFSDLTQYRLGDGLAMHWSRLPDLVPAMLITLLEPLTGRHGAELAAVIGWPTMLFAAALTLLAQISRRLDPDPSVGVIALLLGAIAYPATGFFMPGRIDHHGLQLVLLLVAARGLTGGTGIRGGVLTGVAIAASLAIGLETAPLCAVILVVMVLRWILAGHARDAELAGCGAGLAGGMALAALILAPRIWLPLCDAFTPPVAILGGVAGLLLLGLGIAGRVVPDRSRRCVALSLAGIMGLVAATLFASDCLAGPYAAVSPLLRVLWLDHVAEAQPLFAAPPSVAIGYGGLMLAGLVVAMVRLMRGQRDVVSLGWYALLLGAAMLACIQLRLAPFGAALAVPVLAGLVAAARQRGSSPGRIGAWVVSAGILYPFAGSMAAAGHTETVRAPCFTPDNLGRIAALGPAKIAVPVDMGTYVLAATDARVLAAPYHRNGAANIAHYRLFLAGPAAARAAAERHGIQAIAYCPGWVGDLDPMGIAASGSIVKLAAAGQTPGWARAVSRRPELVILRVAP